jgi:Zn-dependent protease with chaperone function
MSSRSTGMMLVFAGVGIVVIGLLVWVGAFSWFGRLPGDIRIERETARVYIPIVSMLVVSIVLTLLLNLLSRFL